VFRNVVMWPCCEPSKHSPHTHIPLL
jgi:hypothetical protein